MQLVERAADELVFTDDNRARFDQILLSTPLSDDI